jgi:hypothetical protein
MEVIRMTARSVRFQVCAILALALVAVAASPAQPADLQRDTLAAFDRYVEAAEARMTAELSSADRFLWPSMPPDGRRAARLDALRRGALIVERLTTPDRVGPIAIPDGLVHHWVGLAFMPGVPIDRAIALLQDYDHHAALYSPRVARARLRARTGETFCFDLRFTIDKGITVVIDTENEASFTRVDPGRAYSRIVSTRVAEVDSPGTPRERQKAPGHDSGYLWRLNTYWRFLARDGGTYLQCESISLTRGIPMGLGWLAGPFVASLPRESLEFTLDTTRRALISH